MQFRTEIDLQPSSLRLQHQLNLMLLGSCFAQNIGAKLLDANFDINVNPFGVLYNPASISQALHLLLDKKQLSQADLFQHGGLFHSFFHHSSYSDAEADLCLENITRVMGKSQNDLAKLDCLLITFGTSFVFKLKESGQVVANCHKIPASAFDRYQLSVHEIVNDWDMLIRKLRIANPSLKLLFTVSPIRHLKDGAHGNQLSKATLLLAIDELQKIHSDVYYFASYEMVLDDLRDYRFYAEDMLHPSQTAIDYIWECFKRMYFDDETKAIISQWHKLKQAVNHRPFNQQSVEHQLFLKKIVSQITSFCKKHPYLNCEKELAAIKKQLLID